MQKIGDIVGSLQGVVNRFKTENRDKFVSREFQKYAYDLAQELNDLAHKSLYMKLAKITPRGLLENARSFVADAENARSKAKLFMWKLKQLKAARVDTQEPHRAHSMLK